ncbi:MAG TPA: isoleucine--tRNA ligase [Candidatus Megaira endosymbiont of Nemacystus decipiens]|nr:isoleucine--tRNA ligase [Candidatus Megaera endosymbiont of Nemacystus decipiens]
MNKNKYYPDVSSNTSFPEIEKKVLSYWKDSNIFQRSIDNRKVTFQDRNKEFVFYDGPPFANGLPHYGHLLTGFIKDTYARYQTLNGKKVERKFGWDCHGLPAEMAAEKELGFSGRIAITEYGVDKFNKHCRKSVMKYSSEWEKYVTRQARWVDFENSYKTMDKSYMESVLWAFDELYKKGLVYESMRVMPYSWACETPLSNFETRLDNSYRQRADKSVTVSFNLKHKPANAPNGLKEYKIMAWTTTPWTLPSNLALAVSPDMNYSCVIKEDTCYILASFSLNNYRKELSISNEDTKFTQISGKELIGLEYKPLFEYFENHPNAFQILSGDFVVEGDGTGIVHIAPGFGEDDQILCSKHNINLVCPVDNAGKFTYEVKDFDGMQVFEANDPIIIKLKKQGNWIKTEQYIHNYPHCWRTDTPLIYKAVPSWYVKVTEFKGRMVELNQQINWIPSHVKDGLFGKWLENARDWSISRNRFWGTPIPVWKSDNPKYPRIDVYGSIKELQEDFEIEITDLHKEHVDKLVRPNPDDPTGKSMMRRVEDVFDCWFESGSMPYAQVHYPFENKEWFETHFPADFIVEYSAQTRGWFYTLMVLGTALFDRPPFLNCICHGVILDSSGQKLSKRLNNYADPIELFNKYGSDALRVTMLSSTVIKGQELLIDKDGKMVFDQLRLFIKPIWNAYHFFCLYANIDNVKAEIKFDFINPLDQYIISKLKITIDQIKIHMDSFDSQGAYQAITEFFEILNNWYIRRSRPRFWQSEKNKGKTDAYNALFTCLVTIMKAASSLLPLISEHIYRNLTLEESVHLTNYPTIDKIYLKPELVKTMENVMDICNASLFVRNEENIRVRQPISKITIITKQNLNLENFTTIIQEEINVKEVIYSNNLSEYADEKLVINFPILGKRLPSKMKDIIIASKQRKWKYEDNKLSIANEILKEDEYSFTLKPRTKKGAGSLSSNQGIVILDLNLTKELKQEGIARDVIRLVQQARKDAGLEVSSHIKLELLTKNDNFKESVLLYSDLIEEQTLSNFNNITNPCYSTEAVLLGEKIVIKIL